MKYINWDSVIDSVQAILVWFVIFVVASCTAVLILFDVLAGTGIMYYLTNSNIYVSVLISMATTGLLMALMFIGYTLMDGKTASTLAIGRLIMLAAGAVFILDIIFDSYTADVLRFMTIVALDQIPNPNVHLMFRALMGGISSIGEALGGAIIIGMPVLKNFINGIAPKTHTPQRSAHTNYNQSQFYSRLPKNGIAQQTTRPAPRPQPVSSRNEPTYHPIFHSTNVSPEVEAELDELESSFRQSMGIN